MTSKNSDRFILIEAVISCLLLLGTTTSCSNAPVAAERKSELFGSHFPSVTGFTEILPSQDALAKTRIKKPIVTEIQDSSGVAGYCIESEVVSRSGPFRIRVLVDSELYVKQAAVLSYPWDRGKEVRKEAFTLQFIGKSIRDPIRINSDIAAVTGATISCDAMAKGVRKSIQLADLLN